MIMKKRLHVVVVLSVLAIIAFGAQIQAAERSMVLSGSGGYVAEISEKIWMEPFTKATGIKIKRVSSETQRMAQLEAMVQSGKTLWDATEVSASNYPIGVQKNLFEPIDYSLADPDNVLPEIAKLKYGVGAAAYSVVLVEIPQHVLEAGLAFRVVVLHEDHLAAGDVPREVYDLGHLLVRWLVGAEPHGGNVQAIESDYVVGAFHDDQADCLERLAQVLVLKPVLSVLPVEFQAAMKPPDETVLDRFALFRAALLLPCPFFEVSAPGTERVAALLLIPGSHLMARGEDLFHGKPAPVKRTDLRIPAAVVRNAAHEQFFRDENKSAFDKPAAVVLFVHWASIHSGAGIIRLSRSALYSRGTIFR